MEEKVVRARDDGSLELHARDATVHGTTLRYEPPANKNTLGYWTRKEDWASWELDLGKPGIFRVDITQGCGKGSGGADVEFALDGQQPILISVQDTGGFQNWITRTIGEYTIDNAGRHTISVRPQSKPGAAVMDLRAITLTPKQ